MKGVVCVKQSQWEESEMGLMEVLLVQWMDCLEL